MEFEWDEAKRQRTLHERGVDVLDASLIFEGFVLTGAAATSRDDYGERRLISLGMVDGECFLVVHTERNGITRLITAWKGGRNDRARYQAGVAGRNQKNEREG